MYNNDPMIIKNFPGQPKFLILLMLVNFTFLPLFSQEKDTSNIEVKIPPLGTLIEAAQAYSPLLKEQEALIKIREWEALSKKHEWQDYIYFFSEFRYGSSDIYISSGGTKYGDAGLMRYNVGTRLQISMFDALDQRRKSSIATRQIAYEKLKEDELKDMIKNDVIRLWTKLESYQDILSVNEDHVAVQQGNVYYAEQSYKAGDIPLVEFARIKEIASKAEIEYHLAKKEFRETYLLLESLVGVKLSTMNTNLK